MARISAVGILMVVVAAVAITSAHGYYPPPGNMAGYGMACPPSGCPPNGMPMMAAGPMMPGYPMSAARKPISKCKPAPMACPPPMCPPPCFPACPSAIEWY